MSILSRICFCGGHRFCRTSRIITIPFFSRLSILPSRLWTSSSIHLHFLFGGTTSSLQLSMQCIAGTVSF